MGKSEKKTIDEHAAFLSDYARLQLWFVWTWLDRHPHERFQEVIRHRVDIYRKTDLNPGRSKNTETAGDFSDPRWLALEERAWRVYRQLRNDGGDADRFEQEAWEIFRPVVEGRIERDFLEGDGLEDFQCGSLRYHDRHPRLRSHRLTAALHYLARGRLPAIFFHIGNRLAPRSIFAEREHLPACFFQLMDETRRRFCAGTLMTTTWLNSYPRWLELFPQEWKDNLSPPKDAVSWSQSSWGQFISARGTLNRKHANALRATGELPFKPRTSWCSFEAMESHLRRYLAERVTEERAAQPAVRGESISEVPIDGLRERKAEGDGSGLGSAVSR